MKIYSKTVAVSDTKPSLVFSFYPSQLHSVVIKADGSVDIGTGSVQSDDGFGMDDGDNVAFSYRDFDVKDPAYNHLVELYAIGAVATSVSILAFVR